VKRSRDHGQSTVELALALPVVVVLLLLVVQVALVIRDHVLVVHAAREAVRAAVVTPSAGRTEAEQRGAVAAGPLDPDRVRVTDELVNGGDRLRVRIDYVSRTDLPLIGALVPEVDLSGDATMRLETNR
jgi:hypothetical protein